MDSMAAFVLGLPGFAVHRLCPEDVESLQQLFDRCSDFAMLVEGEAASPSAAQEVFREGPPGKDLGDKFVLGIVDGLGKLVGLLEGMRDYPDVSVWWIGLLLLDPEARGHGVGCRLVAGFSEYVRRQGGTTIMLGVVEENVRAYRFWQQMGFHLVRQTEPRRFGKKTHAVYVLKWTVAEEEPMEDAILSLEKGAMERWRKGDPWGFIEISAPDVTYFDTGTPARLNGRDALRAEYAQREGKIHYDVMEFIDPRVQVRGDAAVLFYRFFSTRLKPDGSIASRTPWNCSEVFARSAGTWRIVHTHWSFIKGEMA